MEIATIFTSWTDYLLVSAVLVVAEGVYVLFGFGAGLIAVGCLALLLPELQDVVVLLLLINAPPEIWVVSRSRRSISWRGVGMIGAGIVVGVPVGTRILTHGRPEFLLLLLGIFLVVVGLAFLVLADRRGGLRMPRWIAPPVGLSAGILTGIFGTGGPPVILYYRLQGLAKSAFRGNLMAVFFLQTCVRVPVYCFAGLVTPERLWSALAVAPAVLLGAVLGDRIHIDVSEVVFRRLVSVLLVVLGASLLLR